MRIYADINRLPNGPLEPESTIIQVSSTPDVGTLTPINGKFVVDVPEGVTTPRVTEASRLIDTLSPDYIVGDIYDGLRRSFPGYPNVVFNQLLTSDDIAKLDAAAVLNLWSCRFQTGRFTAAPKGIAPGGVSLLPENTTTAPTRPGLMITDTIDIGPLTGFLGASVFVLYWKIYRMSVTDDVLDYAIADSNSPALKNLIEIDQDEIDVFLSTDDGVTYTTTPVERLTPRTVPLGTLVRLAFVNHHPTNKVYVTAYAMIF